MSETGPRRTPDSRDTSESHLPTIEGAPDVLQLDKIDELRSRQEAHASALISGIDSFDYEARVAKRVEAYRDNPSLVEEFLKENGVQQDDPKFDEYASLLRDYSIDEIPEEVWDLGVEEEDMFGRKVQHPPLKLGAYERVQTAYGADSEPEEPEAKPADITEEVKTSESKADSESKGEAEKTSEPEKEPGTTDEEKEKEPESTPEKEPESESKDEETKPEEEGEKKDEADKPDDTAELPKTPDIKEILDADPAIRAARANVVALRSKLAKITAKRQSSLRSGKSSIQEYEDAQTEYQDAVDQLVKLELSAEKTAGLERDKETERLDAAFSLVKHFQELQGEVINEMKNTKVGKFIDFMTRGSTAKKLLKGVGLGLAAGVAGAIVTAATGGAAGAAIATGIGMSTRLARGYARFDARNRNAMDVVDADSRMSQFNLDMINGSDAGDKDPDEAVRRVSDALMDKLDDDTKKEQGKRRSSTYKSLGMIALGGALAETGSILSDHYGSNGLLKNPFGSDNVEAKSGGSGADGTGADTDNSGTGGAEKPSVESENNWDSRPGVDTTGAETISNGEGFYQTFQELNIPAEDRAELLAKVGPQLHDMQVGGQPLAYQMPNGEWGIRMTPDGKMPTDALQLISDTHDQMSGASVDAGAGTGSEFSSGADSTTETTSSSLETSDIDNTPAGVESLTTVVDKSSVHDIMSKDTINASDITGNQQLMDLSHVATWYPPDAIGQKLGLSMRDWNNLESHIIDETEQGNALYSDTFEVSPAGYLRFTGNRIPADTLADMLNNVPIDARV